MAAKTTVKVATLTGAAKDDLLVSGATGLTEEHLSADLNVLANDPGAARLYSLTQDVSALSSGAQFPVTDSARLASGAIITIHADGTIGYDGRGLASLQALGEGQYFTDTFTYTVRMANGALSTATATVQVGGVNDAPTLAIIGAAEIHDTAAADASATISGTLNGHDIDTGDVLTYSAAGADAPGTTLSVDAHGAYSFTVDAATINALHADEHLTVHYTALVTDKAGASASQDLEFTVLGANDLATMGGAASGSVTQDGTLLAAGALSVTDLDHDESGFQAPAPAALNGTYGDFTFDASGAWTYALHNDAGNVRALSATDVEHDTLTVLSSDGSAQETISVTVNGANDAPTLAGIAAVSIFDSAADDTPAALNGTLSGHDVDHGALLAYAVNGTGNNDFGSIVLDAASGAYSFTANADKIDALRAGESKAVTYDALVSDEYGAHASKVLTFTLVGANDLATMGGTATGSVGEDGTLAASGTLSVADRDAGEAAFLTPAVLAGTYGNFTFNAAGDWTYALNNDAANVQALSGTSAVADSLVVYSLDGSAHETISVSIAGKDEPATPAAINPITTYIVNHGQTEINAKQTVTGFDSNDLLAYTGTYTPGAVTHNTVSSFVTFTDKNDHVVEVTLIGYHDLTASQVVHA